VQRYKYTDRKRINPAAREILTASHAYNTSGIFIGSGSGIVMGSGSGMVMGCGSGIVIGSGSGMVMGSGSGKITGSFSGGIFGSGLDITISIRLFIIKIISGELVAPQ
jgi:hypothetical protein